VYKIQETAQVIYIKEKQCRTGVGFVFLQIGSTLGIYILDISALNDNGGSERGEEQRVRSVIRTAYLNILLLLRQTYLSPVNDPIFYSAE
jgi:hypothetical protein